MGFTANIVSLPILVAIWALDSFLFLVAVRIFISSVPRLRVTAKYKSLQSLVDGASRAVRDKLSKWIGTAVRPWVAWIAVVIGALLVRSALIAVLLAAS